MVLVIKKKGESKEQIFKKFSKMFINEDIVDQVRKKQFYKKPSLQRKEDEKEQIKKRYQKRTGKTLRSGKY